MHEFVTHTVLAAYAVNSVNVPSDTARKRREQVNHLRTRLESYIAEHPDYDLVKMRASGSVAKHTAIRGAGGSDADVAAYVRAASVGGTGAEESGLLDWLRDRCIEVYGKTKVADDFVISQHAVGITMIGSGLKIDVAPVLYEGGEDDRGCLITRDGRRVLTSVSLHLKFLNSRASTAGPEYKEFIRLVKAFIKRSKAELGDEFKFKSFLAELIVAHLWDTGWNGEPLALHDYPRAFEQFLGFIVNGGLKEPVLFDDFYSAADVTVPSEPICVIDPVNPTNNVAGAYQESDRLRLVDRAADALDAVTWASAANTKSAANDAWRTLFGPTFHGA
ncbi:CBASS oligonucleotide cyclase [Jatrophihabitans sp. YIM 134969]